MLEEEIEFVKVDALKPSLRNVNVTVKVVDIGERAQGISQGDVGLV